MLLISASTLIPLITISCNGIDNEPSESSDQKSSSSQALFKTKAEAEQAAKKFGCSGSHKMGEMWMACENHMIKLEINHKHSH